MPKTTYIAKLTCEVDQPLAKIELAIYRPPDYAGVVIKGQADASDVADMAETLEAMANGRHR